MSYIVDRRVHVDGHNWDHGGATDYWIQAIGQLNQVSAASATNPGGLSGWNWTTTTLGVSAGASGDFNSSADFTPNSINADAAADQLVFPVTAGRLFGGYDQFQRVNSILKRTCTKLCLEFFGQFATASANETTTGFGLMLGTDFAAAGGAGGIRSGGTASTFFLTSDLGSDTGAFIDTNFHKWKIQWDAANTEWWQDDVSQGTITTEVDIWPQAFKMIAGTTNRPNLAWAHIWYE